MLLAKLARNNDLNAVRMPDSVDEAVRDLMRAREDVVRECRNARHRLKALLLRNGIGDSGCGAWTAAHLRWLAKVALAHSAQQIAFQEYPHAITEATARIARLEQAMRDTLPDWGLAPVVQALHALRGVQLIAAMTLVAQLQDFLPQPHGESSETLLVSPASITDCGAISDPRPKAAPRPTHVLRYPTLANQHEPPSRFHTGWHQQAPSRSPSGNGFH